MKFTHEGRQYETLFGSDIQEDGVYLELSDWTTGSPEVIALAFYGDSDGRFTFSAYKNDLPFDLVERFILMARDRVFPKTEQNEDTALLADEVKWTEQFNSSQDTLAKLAQEAMTEHEAGLTKPL